MKLTDEQSRIAQELIDQPVEEGAGAPDIGPVAVGVEHAPAPHHIVAENDAAHPRQPQRPRAVRRSAFLVCKASANATFPLYHRMPRKYKGFS